MEADSGNSCGGGGDSVSVDADPLQLALQSLPQSGSDEQTLRNLSDAVNRSSSPLRHIPGTDRGHFKPLFTRYLSYMRKLNEKEGKKEVPVDRFIECPYLIKYDNLPPAPVGFEEVKHVIGGLLVLRVITFSAIKSREAYELEQVLHLAQQVEALNKTYGTSIPLMLAGCHRTLDFVRDMARKLTTRRHLRVVQIIQNIFPVVATEDGVLRPAQSLLESDVNTVAPVWFAPGDGELLGSLFQNASFRSNANGKSFMYFSSSQDLRPIIDTRILKLLVLDEQSNICLC